MEYPREQTDGLKKYCDKLSVLDEGGLTSFKLEKLQLPAGCVPEQCDALLCPETGHSGYPSRLYFAERISCGYDRNWNGNIRVGGQEWVAFSWQISPGLTLEQMLIAHLSGFTRQT